MTHSTGRQPFWALLSLHLKVEFSSRISTSQLTTLLSLQNLHSQLAFIILTSTLMGLYVWIFSGHSGRRLLQCQRCCCLSVHFSVTQTQTTHSCQKLQDCTRQM